MYNNRKLRFKAVSHVESGLKEILDRHPGITSKSPKEVSWARQIGTLGGGNHFIEICLDEEDRNRFCALRDKHDLRSGRASPARFHPQFSIPDC